MLSEFANVAMLLFGTVLLFAWVAAMMLDDLDDDNRAGVPINDGFNSISEALYSMFEASTTQNFPAQMLPSFVWSRWMFLFFFVFMALTTMIFLNLVLAVVYNGYSESQGDQVLGAAGQRGNNHVLSRVLTSTTRSPPLQMKELFTNRAHGLAEAFKLLSSNNLSGHITLPDFTALIDCLNRSPTVPTIEHDDLELYDRGGGELTTANQTAGVSHRP